MRFCGNKFFGYLQSVTNIEGIPEKRMQLDLDFLKEQNLFDKQKYFQA